jgi:DNA-binding transcriptional regulator YiaG
MTKTINYKVEVLFPDTKNPKVVETIKVPVVFNEDFGEDEITSDGWDLIEQTRAKYLKRFSSQDVKELRKKLGLGQKEMARLLGLGDKTVARWESTRESPSRVICVLLHALKDGKIDMDYLESLKPSSTGNVKSEEACRKNEDDWTVDPLPFDRKSNVVSFQRELARMNYQLRSEKEDNGATKFGVS